MEKIEVKQVPLFKVTTVRNYRNETSDCIVTLKELTTMIEFNGAYKSIVINGNYNYNLPKMQVFKVGSESGRSYHYSTYQIESETELSEDHFKVLRALNTFHFGQRCGEVVSTKKVEDKYIYRLVSECDSGD